jgi:hypothetical protein
VIAKTALAPFGIAVDEGARRLVEMLKQLKDVPLDKVFQVYETCGKKLTPGAKNTDIYEEYLYEQEFVRGTSVYQVRDVKRWVGGFVSKFPGEILLITTPQIQDWLKSFKGKARTKNNVRDYVIG